MGSRPARKLALIAALGLGLSVSATLALREGEPKQAGNGCDVVLRLPNNIADGAHIADERGFFAENRTRVEWTGKQLHGPVHSDDQRAHLLRPTTRMCSNDPSSRLRRSRASVGPFLPHRTYVL